MCEVVKEKADKADSEFKKMCEVVRDSKQAKKHSKEDIKEGELGSASIMAEKLSAWETLPSWKGTGLPAQVVVQEALASVGWADALCRESAVPKEKSGSAAQEKEIGKTLGSRITRASAWLPALRGPLIIFLAAYSLLLRTNGSSASGRP